MQCTPIHPEVTFNSEYSIIKNYVWTVIMSKNWWELFFDEVSKQYFISENLLTLEILSFVFTYNKKRQIWIFSSSLNLDSKHPLTLCFKFTQTFPQKVHNHSLVVKVYGRWGWNCSTLNTNYNIFGTHHVHGWKKTSKN